MASTATQDLIAENIDEYLTQHQWDPKRQRPELWQLYNGRRNKGETV